MGDALPWVWLLIAGAALVLEMLWFTGALLGAGVAATLVALLTWVGITSSWLSSSALFAILAALSYSVYWLHYRPNHRRDEAATRHQQAQRCIGNRFESSVDLDSQPRELTIDGITWPVRANTRKIPAGSTVVVVAAYQDTLVVEPAADP